MVIKILKYGLLFTTIHILLGSSCKKSNSSKPCRNVIYSFAVTAEFSPQSEIYNVGDTIFLTSSFPKTLINLLGNQLVDYSNSLGVSSGISTSFLDSVNKQVQYGLENFIVFDIVGKSTPPQNQYILNAGKNVTYFESSIKYELKIGFILKEKGLYMLGISDLGSQGIVGKNCTNAGFNMTVTNTNKNFNLFQYALNYLPDTMLQKSIYCFKVQ